MVKNHIDFFEVMKFLLTQFLNSAVKLLYLFSKLNTINSDFIRFSNGLFALKKTAKTLELG